MISFFIKEFPAYYDAIYYGVFLLFLFRCSYTDLKTGKIRNKTVFPMILMGLLLCNDHRLLMGRVLGIIFIFFFGMTGLLGMGDLKLWMGICSFLGFLHSSYAVIIGAFLLIVYAVCKERYKAWEVVRTTIFHALFNRKFVKPEDQKGYRMAPFLMAGSIIVMGMLYIIR